RAQRGVPEIGTTNVTAGAPQVLPELGERLSAWRGRQRSWRVSGVPRPWGSATWDVTTECASDHTQNPTVRSRTLLRVRTMSRRRVGCGGRDITVRARSATARSWVTI